MIWKWLLVLCRDYGRRAILTKSSVFLEYMKIHLISLNQDLEADYNVQSKINIQGQIMATEHLLSVATDIMNNSNERYNNDNI